MNTTATFEKEGKILWKHTIELPNASRAEVLSAILKTHNELKIASLRNPQIRFWAEFPQTTEDITKTEYVCHFGDPEAEDTARLRIKHHATEIFLYNFVNADPDLDQDFNLSDIEFYRTARETIADLFKGEDWNIVITGISHAGIAFMHRCEKGNSRGYLPYNLIFSDSYIRLIPVNSLVRNGELYIPGTTTETDLPIEEIPY